MDELNLQEIEKKLNTEYQNGQRTVFWYDASYDDCTERITISLN